VNPRILLLAALAVALTGEGAAQQCVYPAKGQSPQQQNSDEAACYTWAVQQASFAKARTGYLEGRRYTVK